MENEELQSTGSAEAMPAAKRPARKRPVPKKPAVPRIEVARPASVAQRSANRPAGLGGPGLFVLFAILSLGVLNLYYVTWQTGQLAAMTESFETLRANYASRLTPPLPPPPAPVVEEKTALVFSLADANDRALIQVMVSEPAAAYYEAVGRPLAAVLVERKKPLSKFVLVRLFFRDGGEAETLWPFTSSPNDWWLPSCEASLSASSTKTQCPADFLTKYPDIARLLGK